MKTNLFTSLLFSVAFFGASFGQDKTTVKATNYDISDNLDLRAVASIFGESKDLNDFEYRINNPETQISNLDLNKDGNVDYLRVMESVDKDTHLIVLQSVLGKDLYQDVATIEVEKDNKRNSIQVQVVGDVFLFGNNYIYEPVYYTRPIIFNNFWNTSYVIYHSPWYWGYYPAYYSYWKPFPVFRYRNHISTYVNVYNTYNYVDVRRSTRAVAMHNSIRSNAYERQNPRESFSVRNQGYNNSYTMNQTRSNTERSNGNIESVNTRNTESVINGNRSNSMINSTRSNENAKINSANRTTTVNRNSGVELNSNRTSTTRSNRISDVPKSNSQTRDLNKSNTVNRSSNTTVRNNYSTQNKMSSSSQRTAQSSSRAENMSRTTR